MQNSRMNTEPSAPGGNLVYIYRPSVMGSPSVFTLTAKDLEWSTRRGTGVVPFDQMRRVRMSYRPAHMQSHRFVTELWADGTPKLKIESTSWKSMLHQERFDELYSVFVAELHRRIMQRGTATRFEQGSNRFIYWLGFIAFVGVNLALAGLIVRALQTDTKGGAVLGCVFLAVFLWQGGDFVRRNRPGVYRPDALPSALMPKV